MTVAVQPRTETPNDPAPLREPVMPLVVELRGVTVTYRAARALADVSLTVRNGEFFSILGPSGCGKSTLLGVIGGFTAPTAGEVLIMGCCVNAQPPYRRPVNTVFQSYALFPHMTVRQNIGFGLRMARKPRAEIARLVEGALDLVALAGFGERRPSELSGGQQQRVALARALVNRPSVLLLDEPLGALDLKMRKQMQSELIRIHRDVGITFIYVTHDQEEAMTMSDRIAVMDKGVVVQIGAPREVYDAPASLFVADFIGASNIFSGEVTERAHGTATVRLAGSGVVAVPDGKVPRGARSVRIMVRPDQITLINGAAPARFNAIRGVVTGIAYLGTHLQITLRADSGTEFTVSHPRPHDGDRGETVAPVGTEVTASWPRESTLCYA